LPLAARTTSRRPRLGPPAGAAARLRSRAGCAGKPREVESPARLLEEEACGKRREVEAEAREAMAGGGGGGAAEVGIILGAEWIGRAEGGVGVCAVLI